MHVIDLYRASCAPRFSTHGAACLIGWGIGLALVLITAHTQAAQVSLAWAPSTSPGVEGYKLYYRLQNETYTATASLDVGPATTATVPGLAADTYCFAVTAYALAQSIESAKSQEVCTTLQPSESTAPGELITLQAEAMHLSGYRVESNTDASGGALISRLGATGSPPGVATASFPGPVGTYQIIVAYFDENDGKSQLALRVNGNVVDSWTADANLPDALPSAANLTFRVAANGFHFQLAPGNSIALEGREEGNEYARFDNVDFVPVSSGPDSSGPDSSGEEVIVDNQDSTTAQTGIWNVSSGASPWEGESLYSATVNATFSWIPSPPLDGTYQVYAWWTYRSSRSTMVPYRIQHQAGTATVTVNQNDMALGGRWNLLGTFSFTAQSPGAVTVSGENGNACADAVRFVKQ